MYPDIRNYWESRKLKFREMKSWHKKHGKPTSLLISILYAFLPVNNKECLPLKNLQLHHLLTDSFSTINVSPALSPMVYKHGLYHLAPPRKKCACGGWEG